MSRRVNVRVDPDLCVGNAMCRALAPAVFVVGEQGQSVVDDSGVAPLETILQAAAECPIGAINVEDADPGEPLDP